MKITEIEWFKSYRCRVKNRPTYKGRQLKPGAKLLEDKIYTLISIRLMTKEDKYPGEYEMMCKTASGSIWNDSNHEVIWIASGDIEIINEGIKID